MGTILALASLLLLSSIWNTRFAKRIAVAHVLLNILGVMFLPNTTLLTKTATFITADFAGQVAITYPL